MTLSLEDIFEEGGLLAEHIENYRYRSVQLELAREIQHAIEHQGVLVAEAGTGTGKTFAYLIPAIHSGKKTVISTGTKNLQEQLFYTDIPRLKRVMPGSFKAVMLKGRSNYLCHYRLENARQTLGVFEQKSSRELAHIEHWKDQTQRGDIAELTRVPETSPIWQQVTSTTDNCLGQECPNLSDCFLLKARREALEADLLVVNHHLLCADWLLRDEGFGELLPEADSVIVDEAHQLATVASQFLGLSVSSRRMNSFLDDAKTELDKDAKDMGQLYELIAKSRPLLNQVRGAMGEFSGRFGLHEILQQKSFGESMDALTDSLSLLVKGLDQAAERSKGLDQSWRRGEDLLQDLKKVLDNASGDWICWFETFKTSFIFHRTPINVARDFQQFAKAQNCSWVFTSATLTVAGKFDHFTQALGIENARCHQWESPFDYPNQSLFYHPQGLPLPQAPDFITRIIDFAIPVLEASQGRAFILFTSHRALKEAAEYLQDKIDYPLFVQGTAPKSVLLKNFKQHGHGVLLGTASFWEGVDVRGETLSCVIIEKLPFASPNDPVLQARLDAMRRQGEDPFNSYQLPYAVIVLKQGIGRLIRDFDDRGVLMICDPRLLKKRYGQVFLDSVPPMKRTRKIEDIQAFFNPEDDIVLEAASQ